MTTCINRIKSLFRVATVLLLGLLAAVAVPQEIKGTVPLVGVNEQDTSLVDHGCSLTGYTARGSTHRYDHFRRRYSPDGTVPDLPEVSCSSKPVEIVERSIEWGSVGSTGRSYYIQFWIKVNAEGVGRFDIGGSGGIVCGRNFRGLPAYRTQVKPGDVVGAQCFQLGNKYYDAEAELKKTIDQSEICRVVFLDKYGMKGEYKETWYNHDEPICDNMRAIDTSIFCRENQWWRNSHAVPAEDLCDGARPLKTP